MAANDGAPEPSPPSPPPQLRRSTRTRSRSAASMAPGDGAHGSSPPPPPPPRRRRKRASSPAAASMAVREGAPKSAALSSADYPMIILEAIKALNDKNGSSNTAITNHMKDKYGANKLQPLHETILTAHLTRMTASGKLAFDGENYLSVVEKEEPSAPAPAGPASSPRSSGLADPVATVSSGEPGAASVDGSDAKVVPPAAPGVVADA